MKRRSLIQSAVASAGALAFPAVIASKKPQLVLGQSAALTGPAAQLGIQFRAGAKLYFDRVNAQVQARRVQVGSDQPGSFPRDLM